MAAMWVRGLVAAVLVWHWAAARNYDVVFVGIDGYEANAEYLGEGTHCWIRRKDKASPPALFHVLNITKALPRDAEVEVMIYEARNNKFVPSWLKYKRNFCDYVENEKRPIFDELAKLYRFGLCPLEGMFKLENWRPDDKLLPPVLPGPDRMMFKVTISSGATIIHKYGVIFVVDRSKLVNRG